MREIRNQAVCCFLSFLLVWMAQASTGRCAPSFSPDGKSNELSRKVLVLYNSAYGQEPHRNNIFHHGLSTIFNYYGLDFDYHDINTGLPKKKIMPRYRAVVTVFESMAMKDPKTYLQWLLRQMDNHRKVLVFGWLGTQYPDGTMVDPEIATKVYARFGLRYLPNKILNKTQLRYDHKAKGFVDFERRYPPVPPLDVIALEPIQDKGRVLLTAKQRGTDFVTALMSVSPHGGFALAGSIYWMDPSSYQKKWYMNPFAFTKTALHLDNAPIPDPTTRNGLRVAFSHVDADGFSGFTNIDTSQNCAQVMQKQVYEFYDFPITSSIIAAEVNPEDMGNPELVEQARSIFAMDNIEPASHAYTHPFYWNMGRKAEDSERFDVAGAYSAPDYKLDSKLEILGSCAYVTELSPKNKPCRIILWSGSCNPTEAQLNMARKAGILNMNGGDTVFDQARDSLFSVSALYRKVGREYQIYTGQANENILTNLWTGPYWGFHNIIETMERTESPRRLKPIDIYYHFYSAEKLASLNALKQVYAWTMERPVAPVFTSQYIEMVFGFTTARIFELGPGRFRVTAYGRCTTMRFAPDSPAPDLERCSGVVGWVRLPQGMYVSLDAEQNAATIVLGGSGPPVRPYLRKATGSVSALRVSKEQLRFTYQAWRSGWDNGWLELAGLRPRTKYSFTLNGRQANATSDGIGVLRVENATTGTFSLQLQ